jgi:hypothetical protein
VLPDIVSLKSEIAERLSATFRERVNAYLGAVHEMPRNFIKEGRSPAIIRPDGSRDETKLKQTTAEIEIRTAEVPALTLQDRIDKLDTAAREMASQISRNAFAEINRAVEAVGNVVDSGGKRLSADTYLEVLEKMQLDFGEDGKPRGLTVVVPPALRERAAETIKQLRDDPEYKKRYEDLLAKKRREFNAREAARKLVG